MTAMTTTAQSLSAPRYLAAVEHQLADLPPEERSALLEDLALHLDALAEEDDDRPLEVRLGRPADYAAELRAAAGLPARGRAPAGALPAVRRDVERLLASRPVREVRAFAPQLLPAWWVLRGYLVVLLPSLLVINGTRDVPVPAPLGSHVLGVALVVAAVLASVSLGRRRLPRPAAALVVVLDVAVLLAALVVLSSASDRLERVVYAQQTAGPSVTPEQPLMSPHGPVTDVLPYAADGTPLEGVLLFDQDGRPLRVGQQQWWADGCRRVLDQPRAADGVPVPYSYPQQYVLDGAEVNPPGQCVVDRDRPSVPLPVFPAPAPAAPLAPPPAG